MPATEFPDRRDRLFGRADDIGHLFARTERTGLTAVVAGPRMGKSWLLTELARRCAEDRTCLVGFKESFGETPDLLLRTIVDLYQRWLADSTWRQQASMIWEQSKDNLLPGFAKVLGKIVKELPGVGKLGGGLINEAIEGLVAANDTLVGGGVKLPTLQYEQARDLIKSVADITSCRIVLIFDQWEKSCDPALEAKTLDVFLRHTEDWPNCHVVVALRPDGPAHAIVERLAKDHPRAMIHPLADMKLDEPTERERMLGYLNGRVPAAARETPDRVLELIGGYPGVIERWTADDLPEPIATEAALALAADNAHGNRFPELEDLLGKLDGDQRKLAARLSVLPLTEDRDAWRVLQPFVLRELPEDALDDLRHRKVLEARDPPSFGHAKRREAAESWFRTERPAAIKAACRDLILPLAQSITSPDQNAFYAGAALAALRATAERTQVDRIWIGLCHAAASLFGAGDGSSHVILVAAQAARTQRIPNLGPLLAMGLFNTLNDAKAEGDLARRDALLDELRGLMRAYPDDAAVRERLAMGLFNTLNHAKAEGDRVRRDALLDELRGLARAYPDDAAVRERLAMGLFNTLNHAKAEGDLARRDALLDELRRLMRAYPDDAAVRERLAKGLFNTLNDAKAEGDLARRDALLDELRGLMRAYPDDAAVRERLAMGLFNTLNHAKAEGDLARRDALLDELRGLARAYPDDAAVRERLAMGLFNTLNHAKAEDNLARRDALLDELRRLMRAYPDDAAVREQLAKGLVNTLNDAKAEDDLARRDALLDELRALARAYPDDAAVRERLAMGLFNTLIDAKAEDNLARRDALLDELRGLARAYPDDAAVRERLAMGLFNTLNHAKAEDNLARRDALLDELRRLMRAYPDDAAVREQLAKGLVNTLNDAKAEDDLARRDALLDELRALARAYPDDAAVRERLAMGLFNTLIDAKAEDNLARRDALLDELRTLFKTYPNDSIWRERAKRSGSPTE